MPEPFDLVDPERILICDFGQNQEGQAVVGEITMLLYQFVCAAETDSVCNCKEKEEETDEAVRLVSFASKQETQVTDDGGMAEVDDDDDSEALMYTVITVAATALICVFSIICISCMLKKHRQKLSFVISR